MTKAQIQLAPKTIHGINLLPLGEIRSIYSRLIPTEILERFDLSTDLYDSSGNDLIHMVCKPGSSDAEMSVFHRFGAPDPILYGHITDTISGQIHILLYTINDPESERYNVDRMPDGSSTLLGAAGRNIQEELRAMRAGLAPGQIHRGLRLLYPAASQFERFVQYLGHDLYFAEPLFYHTALQFERYGFSYQVGRKFMERIAAGFSPGGDLQSRLDGSTPFRQPEAMNSLRLRSWAIHDGILGEPFNHVTMYKRVGKSAGINTCPECPW